MRARDRAPYPSRRRFAPPQDEAEPSIPISPHRTTHTSSLPRRVVLRPGFAPLLRSPELRGSEAPRDVRVFARHPLDVPGASKTRRTSGLLVGSLPWPRALGPPRPNVWDYANPADPIRHRYSITSSAAIRGTGRYGISGLWQFHCGLMLAARTTLLHFSVSSATSFPNSAGVIGMGSPAS